MLLSRLPSRASALLGGRTARRAWSLAATSGEAMALEDQHCARTYAPLPFVVARARGSMTWSPEGVPRLDFLAAFSAVNQGHCHPALLAALAEQAGRLTLISRAFHADGLGAYARELCGAFGYERMLPANSGVEAWEVALKLARRLTL